MEREFIHVVWDTCRDSEVLRLVSDNYVEFERLSNMLNVLVGKH